MSKSLFEKLGGEEAIVATVEIFYEKVINDPLLSPFFETISMDAQGDKMIAFVARAFGGPDEFKGKDLRVAHKHLVDSMGLNDNHFDSVSTHLAATLNEMAIDQNLIDDCIAIVESTRDDVLNR